jgi:hypothetical protein
MAQGNFKDVKRGNYFQGMMLVDKDFKDEQFYHRQMRQNHNLELHTWGVVRGLELIRDKGALAVTEGLAIDASGREVWSQGGPAPARSVTEGNYLVIESKEEQRDKYPPMGETYLRLIDTASFSWKSSKGDADVVLAQLIEGKPDNSVRRNAASVHANGNDIEISPVGRGGALRLKTGGSHQDFCAGAANLSDGTAYAGFNVARIGGGGSPKWSFGSDGVNSGGALIFGDIFGKLRFVTVGSPGRSQDLDDAGILDRTRMTINESGSVGIGTVAPESPLHIKVPGGAGGNVLNLEGTDHVYMQWYPAGYSAGRKGLMGYGSANDKNLTIKSEFPDGHLVLSSASGKVGIGVTNPGSALEVRNSVLIREGSLSFSNADGNVYNQGWIGMWPMNDSQWMHIGGITGSDNVRRLLLAAQRTFISGRVGIATSNPEFALQVGDPDNVADARLCVAGRGETGNSRKWTFRTGDKSTATGDARAAEIHKLRVRDEDAGADRFVIDQNGNVGIGTTSPGAMLEVNGNVQVGGKITCVGWVQVGDPDKIVDARLCVAGKGETNNWRKWTFRTGDKSGATGDAREAEIHKLRIRDEVAALDRFVIDASGNVGIGTTDPSVNRLRISSQLGGDGDNPDKSQHNFQVEIRNGFGNKALAIGLLNNGKGVLQAKEVNVGYNDLLLNPVSGKVGIGTTSPDGQLEIRNPATDVKVKFGGKGGDVHHLSSTRDLVFNSVDGIFTFRKINSFNDLGLFTDSMKITTEGDVKVTGRISCGGWIALKTFHGTYVTAEQDINKGMRQNSTRQDWEQFTLEMACSRELKENIADISREEAMATLQNLNPVKYDYKGEKAFRQNLGFIAEEMPDNLASEDRRTVSPFEVVPILTRVAKEQQASIARLQETVRALQERIDWNEVAGGVGVTPKRKSTPRPDDW